MHQSPKSEVKVTQKTIVRPKFRDMNDPLVIKFKETLGSASATSSPMKSTSKRMGGASPDPTPLKKDPKTGQVWKLVDTINVEGKVKLDLPENPSKEDVEKAKNEVIK